MVSVGYQGEAGAYSHQAVIQFLGPDAKAVPFSNFDSVFENVAKGELDFGLVPIENVSGGSIHRNFDLLNRWEIFVIGEYNLEVNHCLLAVPGTNIRNIKKVISHPQALAQCEQYVTKKIGAKPEDAYDTAGAALLLSQGKHDVSCVAALASEVAAKEYGLEILEKNVQDVKNNFTRFLLICRERININSVIEASEKYSSNPLGTCAGGAPTSTAVDQIRLKTTLTAAMPHKHLFRALGCFHLRSLPVLRVESRPLPTQLRTNMLGSGKYSVWDVDNMVSITIEALVDSDSQTFANVRRDLEEFAGHVASFGSYVAYPEGSTRRQIECDPNVWITREAIAKNYTPIPEKKETVAAALTIPTDDESGGRALRVCILGFGPFGQFLAKRMTTFGIKVTGVSRTDYTAVADAIGCKIAPSLEVALNPSNPARPDVLLITTSITSFESVLASQITSLPAEYLANLVIVDALSVKQFPKELLSSRLPSTVGGIICTHPMFGPDSGKGTWAGLPVVYEKIKSSPATSVVEERFLAFFSGSGCRMIEMSCEEHDQIAASSQFLTHLTGRILGSQRPVPSQIDTQGFKSLLEVVRTTNNDSWDLFNGLYRFNSNADKELETFTKALFEIKSTLQSGKRNSLLNSANPPEAQVKSMQVSALAKSTTPSATVAVHAKTQQLKAEGKSIISLAVGEPDYGPPAIVSETMVNMLKDNKAIKYTDVAGILPLRTAIVERHLKPRMNIHHFTPNDIVVSNGAKQSVYQTVLALVDPGDEVLIHTPCWVSYPDIVKLARGVPVLIPTKEADGFMIDVQDIRKYITVRTRAIIICTPNNPTGSVCMSEADVKALAALLEEPQHKNITVIEDAIYEQLTYSEDDNVVIPTPVVCGKLPADRVVLINGFSKSLGIPGLRVGYSAAPPHITKAIVTLQGQITSCASAVAQAGVVAGLNMPDAEYDAWIANVRKTLKVKRNATVAGLKDAGLVLSTVPTGAFYGMPRVDHLYGKTSKASGKVIKNSVDFCAELLEVSQVALVPGDAFFAPECVRISYATDFEVVLKAVEGVKNFVNQLI